MARYRLTRESAPAFCRSLRFEGLESRIVLDGIPQLPLPSKVGEAFVIDDWDNDLTLTQFGNNYFGGNNGDLGDSQRTLSPESNSTSGNSLRLSARPGATYGGFFTTLFRPVVDVTSDPSSPLAAMDVPNPWIDLHDFFGGFGNFGQRTIEELRLDFKHDMANLRVRVEFKGSINENLLHQATIDVPNTAGQWETKTIAVPAFPAEFRVKTIALVVEDAQNTVNWSFLADNLRLVDTDGSYPDLDAAKATDGSLLPQYADSFLEYVRETSSRYFFDFASHFGATGGIVQDRATFADLMTVGGVGFQLSSYVIDAARGYLTRAEAAANVLDVLRVLGNADGLHPQGPGAVGTIGYKGFFYHFLGTDGLRKQNGDYPSTPSVDESKNTIELSTIDTALAIAGVVTAGQFFDGASAAEQQIRSLANQIYGAVDWEFMINRAPGPKQDQFYLGWKPNEPRVGPAFEVSDASGLGGYSGTPADPATVDIYTDEGLLIALLAMGSPNPAHRIADRRIWDAMKRDDQGGDFVRSYPGSLFTYQFGSVWLDTARLGSDNHPTQPVNFFDNTQRAIDAVRQYVQGNPNDRVTFRGAGANLWGLSAVEGPFERYFAEAAPPAALALVDSREAVAPAFVEGETRTNGVGTVQSRSRASGLQTLQIVGGQTATFTFSVTTPGQSDLFIRYSNDQPASSGETVLVSIDGNAPIQFQAANTRRSDGSPGSGWDAFVLTPALDRVSLASGLHSLTISVAGGDAAGVEIDVIALGAPLEVGTVASYAIGSSVVHNPSEATKGLWQIASNGLLHSRFGIADAFNLEAADAAYPGSYAPATIVRPPTSAPAGPWASFNGFAINHGPMLIIIDNYLEDQFIPNLFMSHAGINSALLQLFPAFSPVPGDFNDDRAVDAADLAVWRQTFGQSAALAADGDADGNVDGNDLLIWQRNVGRAVTNSAIDQALVASTAAESPDAGREPERPFPANWFFVISEKLEPLADKVRPKAAFAVTPRQAHLMPAYGTDSIWETRRQAIWQSPDRQTGRQGPGGRQTYMFADVTDVEESSKGSLWLALDEALASIYGLDGTRDSWDTQGLHCLL